MLIAQQICLRCGLLLLIIQLHLLKAVTLITAMHIAQVPAATRYIMTSYFLCCSVVAVLRHPDGNISAWSVALK